MENPNAKRRQLILAASLLPTLVQPRFAIAAPAIDYKPGFVRINKGLWVWQSGTPITDYVEVIEYAKAAGYTEIYWSGLHTTAARQWLMASASSSRKNWQVLKRALGDIKLFAACGDPSYVYNPDIPDTVMATFEVKQETAGLLAGIHFDIEVHSLDAWDKLSNRPGIAAKYVALLDRIKKHMRGNKLGLRLAAALHPTYCFVPMPGAPSQRMYSSCLAHINQVMLMAYRNVPSRTMEWLDKTEPGEQSMLAQTLLSGKAFSVGITTKAGSETGVSYAGTEPGVFQDRMVELHNLILARGGDKYGGISIHDYYNRIV